MMAYYMNKYSEGIRTAHILCSTGLDFTLFNSSVPIKKTGTGIVMLVVRKHAVTEFQQVRRYVIIIAPAICQVTVFSIPHN